MNNVVWIQEKFSYISFSCIIHSTFVTAAYLEVGIDVNQLPFIYFYIYSLFPFPQYKPQLTPSRGVPEIRGLIRDATAVNRASFECVCYEIDL